jgi:hypothetical protein
MTYRTAARITVLFGSLLVMLAVTSSPAFAQSAWWHLSSSDAPATLQSGSAKDEVQKLAVNATGGEVTVIEPLSLEEEEHGTGSTKFSAFAYNATHQEAQAALEEIYGAGNVRVTGGPVGKPAAVTELEPYEVTFVGELADRKLKPMNTALNLFGLEGEATVSELTQGASDGFIVLTAVNVGDGNVNPAVRPVEVSDVLPPGLKAVEVEGSAGDTFGGPGFSPTDTPLECSVVPVSCTYTGKSGTTLMAELPPYIPIEVRIGVLVLPGAKLGSEEVNTASIGGGESSVCKAVAEPVSSCQRVSSGAVAGVSISRPVTVGTQEAPFGVASYEMSPEEEGGALDTQAGSHPFQLTTTLALNQKLQRMPREAGAVPEVKPVALAKDLRFKLPPGLIGNPTPFPRCSLADFLSEKGQQGLSAENQCSPQTVVGVARITINVDTPLIRNGSFVVPLFNVEPAIGEPARFGFLGPGAPVLLNTSVRTGGDYGVTVSVMNITQTVEFVSSEVIFWGTPGDVRHNGMRGWGCLGAAVGRGVTGGNVTCNAFEEAHPPPLLALPTSCAAPLQTSVEADSWKERGVFQSYPTTEPLPALDGCNQLQFKPEVHVTPDGTAASTPTGLNVDIHVPQDLVLNPTGLAESNVKDISVALPPGVAVNPAGGDGLQACSEGQVGFTGAGPAESTESMRFTDAITEPFCPDASKIGTVTIHSPLIPNPVRGAVYLATQNENPFGSLIALYLVAEDPVSGFVFKSVGETHLSASGQVIGTFKNNPQLPFEDAELHFFGGERAPLTSPAHCGAYTTNATLTPWSGNAAATASSTFSVNSGPNGSPCPDASLPFSPSLTGGTTNINAGSFSPLTTTIGRADGNQDIQSVQLHMPDGLEGLLSGVKLCPEAQANEGTCGPDSLIGETTVSAGVGNDPVSVKGGRVYITERYAGAPFGLSIVNPVKAGPFDLEHDTSNPAQQPTCDCVVVRAKIEVDPHTAALTITTDQEGPHAIPHLIDGIPVQIKKVNVLVNRPGFTLNPTNCKPLALTGTIASDEGASSPVSVPFQATNCAVLKFQPKVTVSTGAKASKANGANLSFKISYPKGALGSQSWFNEAKFTIPRQFPARLTTIQQACLAATYEKDPEACPPASKIGHAVVHTQLLPVPLEGPVFFVSHGGAKFPDAVLHLKGYGVTFDLIGETLIKNGVTSATFRNTPDVPFESIEVTVPTGKYSEFGVNLPHESYNFCGQHLKLPTHFKASNGLEVNQETAVAVTGCKRLTRAQKLAAALKACHKKRGKKRAACQRAAHRNYGAKKAAKRKKKS